MKLVDALRLNADNPGGSDVETLQLTLICGFTPLHLQTFLTAELRLQCPAHRIELTTGRYDDIPGSLSDLKGHRRDAVVLVLEWPDLDARLGLRQLGGWSPQESSSTVERSHMWLAQVRVLVEKITETSAVVLSLPTLPLPPLFSAAGWQTTVHEARLRENLWTFATALAASPRVRLISPQEVDAVSIPSERLNVGSTWMSGFPYQTAYASRLAEILAQAVVNRLPKKGLITDLDDTLWRGIVGEVGIDNISWDLDRHSQAHGIYQQLLRTLSEEGVLIAVASKNDPKVVEDAFARADLLLPKNRIFPFVVGWGSKAQAVTRVLAQWNISGDSVVFVDDSPTELAEVMAAHPSVECLQFPSRDPREAYHLIVRLRELFGKAVVSSEDAIRVESIRSVTAEQDKGEGGFTEALLKNALAELRLELTKNSNDARALELLNKTNQFNLNGRRLTERGFAEYLERDGAFLLTALYKDRFGTLGKIAAVLGCSNGAHAQVDYWVMSCRAFGRRIEYQCLKAVFETCQVQTMGFEYCETPRNGPMTTWLNELMRSAPTPTGTLEAGSFAAACPTLFHRVEVEIGNGIGQGRYARAPR